MVSEIHVGLQMAGGSTETYVIETATVDNFLGFTSPEKFISVTVSSHDEQVWIDNDLYVSADHLFAGSSNPVPVPGAVWLLATGLLALAGIQRQKI